MKALFAVVCAALLGLVSVPVSAAPFDVGQPAIDFTIQNFDANKEFVLSAELKKSKLVFVFLSSTCSTCLAEVMELKQAQNKNEFGKDAKIYVVNIDFNDQNLKNYKDSFMHPDWVMLHDPKFMVMPKYGLRSSPSTLVIDKEGKIAFRSSGYQSGEIKTVVDAIKAAK